MRCAEGLPLLCRMAEVWVWKGGRRITRSCSMQRPRCVIGGSEVRRKAVVAVQCALTKGMAAEYVVGVTFFCGPCGSRDRAAMGMCIGVAAVSSSICSP